MVQWVPIILTHIMQGLLVVLPSKYNPNSTYMQEFRIFLQLRLTYKEAVYVLELSCPSLQWSCAWWSPVLSSGLGKYLPAVASPRST